MPINLTDSKSNMPENDGWSREGVYEDVSKNLWKSGSNEGASMKNPTCKNVYMIITFRAKMLTLFHCLLLGLIWRVFGTWTGECISRLVNLAMHWLTTNCSKIILISIDVLPKIAWCTGSGWFFMIWWSHQYQGFNCMNMSMDILITYHRY